MFDLLPVELVEKILLYLTFVELYNFIQALDRKHNIVSDHFWRTVCLMEDFLQVNNQQEWFECFERGVNKRLGNFVHCREIPDGKLEHVYSMSLITSDSLSVNVYNVYSLDYKDNFEYIQSISASAIFFKDEFILAQKEEKVILYKYNFESTKFHVFKILDERLEDIFGVSDKYCTVFYTKQKRFKIYSFSDQIVESTGISLLIPQDVKFVIEKILHLDSILISTVTFSDGYRIKMYDIKSSDWILDLQCFTSTGITNDPNVWVGTNFVACCDVSYRLRGIYFGPFKVWNKQGEKLLQADIEPSNKHYLRCFFKDEYMLLTTSDNCIKTFDSFGSQVSRISTKATFEDIKLSTGYILFILVKEIPSLEVYNWKDSCHLYSLTLNYEFSTSLSSDVLYCPHNSNKYEVFKF